MQVLSNALEKLSFILYAAAFMGLLNGQSDELFHLSFLIYFFGGVLLSSTVYLLRNNAENAHYLSYILILLGAVLTVEKNIALHPDRFMNQEQ